MVQLPVRKSERPFICLNVSRTYTGWQMRQPAVDLSSSAEATGSCWIPNGTRHLGYWGKTFWEKFLQHLGNLWARHPFSLLIHVLHKKRWLFWALVFLSKKQGWYNNLSELLPGKFVWIRSETDLILFVLDLYTPCPSSEGKLGLLWLFKVVGRICTSLQIIK